MSEEKNPIDVENEKNDYDGLKINPKTKDSVFIDIFGDKNNACQLYKDLHPEETNITADDIIIQTIQSVFVNTIYNDLGFIVKDNGKDKVIVLFEAQSTWNNNMTLRIYMYLAESYRRYLADTGQSEHVPKRVYLPIPELYLVYTGDKKKVPDVISFNEVYFDGKAPVEMKIKVLKDVNATLYGQYIGFCKVFNEQRKLYRDRTECAKKAIEICLEKGYLSEYVKIHKKEVVSMMEELFDGFAMREQYEKANRISNFAEGIETEKTNTVLRMLADNVPLEMIMKYAAVSMEQIKKIAEEHKPLKA